MTNWSPLAAQTRSINNAFEFTTSISKDACHFLDVTISQENGNYTTDIYCKPTDSKQYLPFNSFHPRHVKRNIPYALAIRIKRIVSNEKARELRFNELKRRLVNLAYPSFLINDAIAKAKEWTVNKSTNKVTSNSPRFCMTYNMVGNHLFQNSVSYNYRKMKNINEKFEQTITRGMKQPPNNYKVLQNRQPRSRKCSSPDCVMCRHLKTYIHSTHVNGKTFVLNQTITCNSYRTIFATQCICCSLLKTELFDGMLKNYLYNHCSHTHFIIIPLFACSELSRIISNKMRIFIERLIS